MLKKPSTMNQSKKLKHVFCTLCRKYSAQPSPNIKQSENIVEFINKSEWRSVVGLEVHVQIASLSKLFSQAQFDFTSPVNSCVSLFDAAIPGTLPILNQTCVNTAVLTSLALNCKVNPVSRFHRKHYFYSDLPAGYQITQYDAPIAQYGHLKFNVFTPGIHKAAYEKECKLTQVQLEQDSGKTIHDDIENRSLIDLNRAGVALMELVFEPDLSDGEEAAALIKELILVLQCLGASTCKMQEGALRVDANVSVNHRSTDVLGVRSEVKNIGSIRGVANAVNYEIRRQVAILSAGGVVVNETRAYDAATRSTVAMRDKENIQDYRFMPDPNLLPLRISESCIANLKSSLPVLPEQLRSQLKDEYKLNVDLTNRLSRDSYLLSLFYKVLNASSKRNPKAVAVMLVIHLMGVVNRHDINLDEIEISAVHLGDLVDAYDSQQITSTTIQPLLESLLVNKDERSVQTIIAEEKLTQIADTEAISRRVEAYIKDNEELVQSYVKKSEKKRARIFTSMMKTLMEQSRNTLNFTKTQQVLTELLEKYERDKEKP